MIAMTPDTVWNILIAEAAGRSFNGLLIRRIHPEAPCDLFLGVEQPGDQRALILQAGRERLTSAGNLPEARGIEVRLLSLPGEQHGKGALVLILKEERFLDIFQTLVRDLAEALAQVSNEEEAVELFLVRLRKWQRFLEVNQGEGLGEEAQRGLYGELWLLRKKVLPLTGLSGISSWTGGARKPQDFQLPGVAIEVKTTLATNPDNLQIHGLRQLDDSGVAQLFLCHLGLVEEKEGETLAQTVALLRQVLKGQHPFAEHFEMLLLEAGYLDRHSPRYNQAGYQVRKSEYYQVDGNFPRLRPGDVRNGVGKVNYTIEIAACRDHIVSFDEVAKAITAA